MKFDLVNGRMAVLGGVGALLLGNGAVAGALGQGTYLIKGASQMVSGARVTSWERIAADRSVVEVGVTIPLAIAKTPPSKIGKGPAGAVAVLQFPKEVQKTTFFNHFELQWNPNGHPPICCFAIPHFDFHFYGVPVSEDMKVTKPDPKPPTRDRLPVGYIYPGPQACVPQMGVHASLPGDLDPVHHPFSVVMAAGFYNGNMTFIEPMATRKHLLKRATFTLAVPRPKVLGRHTRYPTTFVATFDPKTNSYQFVFGHFVTMAR